MDWHISNTSECLVDRTWNCWQDLCYFVSYILLNNHTFLIAVPSITLCSLRHQGPLCKTQTSQYLVCRRCEIWNIIQCTELSNGIERSNMKKNCLSCHGVQEWVGVQTNNGHLMILEKQRAVELCVFRNWDCEVSLGQRSHADCSCLHPNTRLIKKS